MSQRYAIRIAYDGTDFCGWQEQRTQDKPTNAVSSIEEEVRQAIGSAFQEQVNPVASGRTDAGVHASGQVAHFSISSTPDSETHLLDALNRFLPESIRIHQLARVPDSFSARSAIAKQYSYHFLEGPAPLPHLHRYTRWSHRALNTNLVQEAVRHLIGEHDFAVLGRSSHQVSSTIRTMTEAEVSESPVPLPGCFFPGDYQLVRLRLRGSGFLKQMVRRIVGTLILVGEKRVSPKIFQDILSTQDPDLVGDTAPPNGLWLDQVWYQEDTDFPFVSEEDSSRFPFAR